MTEARVLVSIETLNAMEKQRDEAREVARRYYIAWLHNDGVDDDYESSNFPWLKGDNAE